MRLKTDCPDIPGLLAELKAERAYGEVTIRLRHGDVKTIAVTKTFLAEEPDHPTPKRGTFNNVHHNS